MGIRTKKVGITGKYATRYGQKLRKQVKAIEILQRVRSICPFCGKKSIRRQAAGIWKCRGCHRAIAGGAWEFVTTAATTAKTTINRLKKNLESRKKPEKEIDEEEEEETKQKKGQKEKGEKKETKNIIEKYMKNNPPLTSRKKSKKGMLNTNIYNNHNINHNYLNSNDPISKIKIHKTNQNQIKVKRTKEVGMERKLPKMEKEVEKQKYIMIMEILYLKENF